MNAVTHTPGPWIVNDTDIEQEAGGMCICTVTTADDFPCISEDEDKSEEENRADVDAECEANARLIAAAPDMSATLTALTTADCHYDGNEIHIVCASHGDAIRIMREARAAIAKASANTGAQP